MQKWCWKVQLYTKRFQWQPEGFIGTKIFFMVEKSTFIQSLFVFLTSCTASCSTLVLAEMQSGCSFSSLWSSASIIWNNTEKPNKFKVGSWWYWKIYIFICYKRNFGRLSSKYTFNEIRLLIFMSTMFNGNKQFCTYRGWSYGFWVVLYFRTVSGP